ncbi:MAG: hypothetical protein AB2551_00240 [Candidatus Thiodiazotropha sp.]
MRIIKDITALVVGVGLFSLIPIYGVPFGGCIESGIRSFATGCSPWPEFLRGFMFIAAIVIIAVHKKPLTFIGLATVLLVVLAGGVALIGTGEEMSYFQANYLAILEHLSNPLLLGSFAALLMYAAITKVFALRGSNAESA